MASSLRKLANVREKLSRFYLEDKMKYFLLVVMCCAAIALPAAARTWNLGVGPYGGYDMPVIQTDVGAGPMWGVGVRSNLWHFVHGQVFVHGTSNADKNENLDFGNGQTETVTYKGGTLTGYGIHLLLAHAEPVSVWPYALVGLSSNSQKFGDSFKKSASYMGWDFGGGLAVNLYEKLLYIDANTTFLVMPFHSNKATRKNWQTLVGLQYFIPIGSN
jgi:hypothetical protein